MSASRPQPAPAPHPVAGFGALGDTASTHPAPASSRAAALPPGVEDTAETRCLLALLEALGWRGGPDELLGALPHAEPRPDLIGLRNALVCLGHPTRPRRLRRGGLDARRLPALLVRPGLPPAVLTLGPRGLMLFDGALGEAQPADPRRLSGTLYLAEPVGDGQGGRQSWVAAVARRFRPELPALLALSALVTLLGLAVPLFSMLAFDVIAGGRDAGPLPLLALGALGAVLAEAWFRAVRRGALSRLGARLDRLVSAGVFGQLMALPAALVDRAGPAAQVSRLRDFGGIRELLTGAFALAALDLPCALIVVALMAWLGGWIALVPLAAAALFALLHLATRGAVRRAVNAASRVSQTRDALAVEMLAAQRTLRLAGAEGRWAGRYAERAAEAALLSARAAALAGNVAAAAQALVPLSALAALVVGAGAVLGGAMSPGALIAGMMLIWRVLAPLQSAFSMLSRWDQVAASVRQVDGMMALETERPPPGQSRSAPPDRGDLAFHRVSLRYAAGTEPVLAGVSFAVRHGEVVAVTGPDGSGKSTLMRLAAGLYKPQGGMVRLGGTDLRAFDPGVLRRAVAAVPQRPDLLYGTIAQNLRLGAPSATDTELRRACADADALTAVEALPRGFETRVGDNATGRLPHSLLVRLCLARALLRDAPLLLLDQPETGLDDAGAEAIARVVALRRGRAAILLATHRPSLMRLADRVLRVEGGAVEEVRPRGTPQRVPVFAGLPA